MEFSNLRIGKYLPLDMDRVEKQVSSINNKICLRCVDFDTGEKITNACTCADTNGHNFENTKNVHGILHIFADEGLHFSAVLARDIKQVPNL